jgi:hypothetical protein
LGIDPVALLARDAEPVLDDVLPEQPRVLGGFGGVEQPAVAVVDDFPLVPRVQFRVRGRGELQDGVVPRAVDPVRAAAGVGSASRWGSGEGGRR